MPLGGDPFAVAVLVVGCLLYVVTAGVSAVQNYAGDERDRVAEAQQAYLDHDSVEQLEADLERALRVEHAEAFRRDLERIPHIGPETSAAIVAEFQSRRALRRASREDVTAINGVGPSIYAALRERYGDGKKESEPEPAVDDS